MSPISKSNEIINNHSIDFKGGNNADLLDSIIGSEPRTSHEAPVAAPSPLPELPPFPSDQYYGHNAAAITQPQYGMMSSSPYYGMNNYNTASMYGLYRYGNRMDYSPLGQNPIFSGVSNGYQSVFQTVSAIAALLEQARHVYITSHEAAHSVAENYSSVTSSLVSSSQSVWSSRLVRLARYALVKMLRLLRLLPAASVNAAYEELWTRSSPPDTTSAGKFSLLKSLWNISMWILGPLYLWKLLKCLFKDPNSKVNWKNGKEHFPAIGKFDYNADSARKLSFKIGQRIIIAPQEQQTHIKGWLLASTDGVNEGLIPLDYVTISKKIKVTK